MLDRETVARLDAALVSRAGGYLRNPVRRERVTCGVCATPAAGYEHCYQCKRHLGQDGLADAAAFLTYAVSGRQSGYVMRGYKARPPVPEHRTIVALLLLLALAKHADCPGALAGAAVTHWAVVPSLPARPGEHPLRGIAGSLHGIAGQLAPGCEARLAGAASVAFPRDVDPAHFSTGARLPGGSHVLLLDDTWAGGGHAQSAVLALRKAGALRVSVLVVARWIKDDFGDNAKFLRELSGRDYDPGICPWTGGGCPPAGTA
ncbi:MAG TPA: hypothetical protein VMV92_40245 [Streptosporangiaceae bacterium]|nr:hypothetical protein [Streptosporangiaceae bacterium]